MGVLRLMLAICVVLWHCPEGIIARYLHPALAVQCFYAISGFLIQWVIPRYYTAGNPHWYVGFYKSRLMRLLPIFWLVTLVSFLQFGNGAISALWASHAYKSLGLALVTNIIPLGEDILRLFTFHLDTYRFVLLPPQNTVVTELLNDKTIYGGGFTVLGQSWTLGVEMWFYLCAPFLLLCPSIVLVVVLVLSVAFRLWLAHMGYTQNGFLYGIIFSELAIFLSGAFATRFYLYWLDSDRLCSLLGRILPYPFIRPILKSIGFFILPPLLYFYFIGWKMHTFGGGYGWGLMKLPNVWWIVIVATAASLPWLTYSFSRLKWDRFLGDLSYPVYMTHMTILGYVTSKLSVPTEKQCLYVLLISVAVSITIVFLLERPFDNLRHKLFPKNNKRSTIFKKFSSSTHNFQSENIVIT